MDGIGYKINVNQLNSLFLVFLNSISFFYRCNSEYVKITDTTGTYISCGYKKVLFDNQLCSSMVYVSYLANGIFSSLYKGFQLYYECTSLVILKKN